jgi:uncharacterized protein YbcI
MTNAVKSGDRLALITDALTRLQREHYGKGPTHARSYVSGDVVTCVMRDVLTTVEQTLVERGKEEVVCEMRRAFNSALKSTFVESVETVLDRKVSAFLSQIAIDPDIAVLVFVLEPEGNGEVDLRG